MNAPAITILTDFGTADGYVAEMKGVLLSGAPGIAILDMSHDVPAHDVEFARLTVARYWRRYPQGTVHLVVVDPGVGGVREAIAVESDGRFLVGPDNGVLSPALFALDARTVSLPVVAHASATFHGRDVFAPVAAALATGAALDDIGTAKSDPVRRRTPLPLRRRDGAIVGEILTIDRFGNALTNVVARDIASLQLDGRDLRFVRAYSDAAPGEAIALAGSSGFVEIAVRDGSAAAVLSLYRGAPVSMMQSSRA